MSEWRPWVFANKKAIIWDLDNTLYRITPEFGDILDSVMARVCVEQLGVDLDFETAKAKVKESFAQYRDGGEIFYRDYGVDVKEFYNAYHNNVPYEMIVPYEGLAERLRQLPLEQYVFTYSSHSLAEKILKHLGLYDIFKGVFIRSRILTTPRKMKAPTFICSFATKSARLRKTVFLWTTAIPI